MKIALVALGFFFSSFLSAATAQYTVQNFVWKNPSLCKLDSIIHVLLLEEAKSFPVLQKFWTKSSLCSSELSRRLNVSLEYQQKFALVQDLKRAFNLLYKNNPAEFRIAINDKRFQRFAIQYVDRIYKQRPHSKWTQFNGMLNSEVFIQHIENNDYSQYSKKDIRRLIEFEVHRSINGKTYDGNKLATGAYGSVMKVAPGLALVGRYTWSIAGDPSYEPQHASDEITNTLELGLATLGGDTLGAEIVGIIETSNTGKPNRLIAMNIRWTPENQYDFELGLTAWMNLDKTIEHEETEEGIISNNLGNEVFIGISGSYKFKSFPTEPLHPLFRRIGKGISAPFKAIGKAFKSRKNKN